MIFSKTSSTASVYLPLAIRLFRISFKQFNKLTLDDKLAALTLIMFMYSEDMYFSKFIENEVRESKALCEAGKTGQDIISFTPFFDPLEILRESHSLDKRHEIPNLLSEKYKLS